MKMKKMPEVTRNENGAFWKNTYEKFEALVYVPKTELQGDILNYGFNAPYLLIFAEKPLNQEEAVSFARETGFEKLASNFASSVVFISPVADGKVCHWKNAEPDILSEIISNSRIHQYHKDGVVIANNFFRHSIDGYYIRGAIFRAVLIGFGQGADYIAENCLHHFEGDGLWGRSDLAPATCILNGLTVAPEVGAYDIPVISYGNSEEANELFEQRCKHFIKRDGQPTAEEFISDYYSFARQFRRMNGPLQIDPDLEKDGLVIERGIAEVKTSPDNCGDDKGTANHKIGYFAFYNKGLFDGAVNGTSKPVPLVLGFHGGGDSCFFFATMAGWAKIAHRHNFLLVTIENHLNSTATEMIELLEILKKKYNIDTHRIYATGFSMGGCKTWDMVQEYPQVIAAAAPMDATWDVGLNVYGNKVEKGINTSVPVPIFYAGGEVTPLPELPFQEQKCLDRMAYVLLLNNAEAAERYENEVRLENKDSWENKIWGINGDEVEQSYDESRDATLTMQKFRSTDGRILSVFGSISGQGHDCREHTCEHAWKFMSQFTRD